MEGPCCHMWELRYVQNSKGPTARLHAWMPKCFGLGRSHQFEMGGLCWHGSGIDGRSSPPASIVFASTEGEDFPDHQGEGKGSRLPNPPLGTQGEKISQVNEELLETASDLAQKGIVIEQVSKMNEELQRHESRLMAENKTLIGKVAEAQSRADDLQIQLEDEASGVSDLFDENVSLKIEDKKMRDEIARLMDTVSALESMDPESITMNIEVNDSSCQKVRDLEATVSELRDRILELEDECSDLKTVSMDSEQLVVELQVQKSKREEMERVCLSLKEELDAQHAVDPLISGELESKLDCMSDELDAVRGELLKVGKEKFDLDVLCSNLMRELDMATESQATQLADNKALQHQLKQLEAQRMDHSFMSAEEKVHLNLQVIGGGGGDEWLQEEIEDLKDDIKRKDLSLKNMDVLLKGLLEENKLLKSRQAKDKEMMLEAEWNLRRLEQEIAAEKKQRLISAERDSLRKSLMVRLKDSDEDRSSSDETNADPEYVSEVESTDSPVNPAPSP